MSRSTVYTILLNSGGYWIIITIHTLLYINWVCRCKWSLLLHSATLSMSLARKRRTFNWFTQNAFAQTSACWVFQFLGLFGWVTIRYKWNVILFDTKYIYDRRIIYLSTIYNYNILDAVVFFFLSVWPKTEQLNRVTCWPNWLQCFFSDNIFQEQNIHKSFQRQLTKPAIICEYFGKIENRITKNKIRIIKNILFSVRTFHAACSNRILPISSDCPHTQQLLQYLPCRPLTFFWRSNFPCAAFVWFFSGLRCGYVNLFLNRIDLFCLHSCLFVIIISRVGSVITYKCCVSIGDTVSHYPCI